MNYSHPTRASASNNGTIHKNSAVQTSSTQWHRFNLYSYIFNLLVSYGIGVLGLLNGTTNREQSSKYLTIISPVGYTFAIWGLIFTSHFIWVAAQFVSKPNRSSDYVGLVGYNYLFLSLAQAGWTLALSYEKIELMMACKLAILFFSWRIVNTLATLAENVSFKNYMVWKFPFSIQFGFILDVTAINISIVLVYLKCSAEFQFFVGLCSLAVLLPVGLYYTNQNDFTVPLLLIWYLVGVYNELTNPREVISGFFTANQMLYTKYASVAVMMVLGMYSLYGAFHTIRNRMHQRQTVAHWDGANSSHTPKKEM